MVANIFFMPLLILFIIALLLILLNGIFIAIWLIRKRKGKIQRKRYLIISIVFLFISILIPSIWYYNNIMAGTGKLVYWDNIITDRFNMDGITYTKLYLMPATGFWKLGKPVTDVKYIPDGNGFQKFISFIFDNDFDGSLYPIENEKGYSLYTKYYAIYCPEDQKDSVCQYYADLSNYDTQNCTYHYAIFSESFFETITGKSALKEGIFMELCELYDNQPLETINKTEIDIRNRKDKKVGSPVTGFEYRDLNVYSKDGVMQKEVWLGLIEEQIYCIVTSDENYITGHRLPDDINEYLKSTIFQ